MAATPVAPVDITALPTAPARTMAPAVFVPTADAFVAALPTFGTETNTIADNVYFNAGSAFDSAGEAAASQAAALASKNSAVAATNYAGAWSTLTGALAVPASAQHNGTLWLLLTSLANVAASEPGVTGDWAPIDQFVIEERTSNTILSIADFGKVLKYTTGGYDQTFTAAATLGNGWYFQGANYSTSVVTLNPSGGELINGAATLAVPPGHCVIASCTGTAFRAIVLAIPVGDHSVVVTTGNGHGSTNTKIRRFTTTLSSTGTAITYADSAANGASFTINEAGLYSISYCDYGPVSTVVQYGVSKNSAQLTTDVGSITATDRVAIASNYESTGNPWAIPLSISQRFAAGDVIRPHTNGTPNSSSTALNYFSITKIGV